MNRLSNFSPPEWAVNLVAPPGLDPKAAKPLKDETPKKRPVHLHRPLPLPSLRSGLALGSQPQAEPQRKRPVLLHRPLPLLGSNQDSPDPEGAVEHPEFQQLATLTRVRVTRCWSLLGFILDFAVLYSLKC